MPEDLEAELRKLRDRLLTLEVQSHSDRRWLLIVGAILLGALGYTSFAAIPREVRGQLPDSVAKEVATEAPKHVRAEFEEWLGANNGAAILEDLRAAQTELAEIAKKAKADGAEIRRLLIGSQSASGLDNRIRQVSQRIEETEEDISSLQNSAIKYGNRVRIRNERGGKCMGHAGSESRSASADRL